MAYTKTNYKTKTQMREALKLSTNIEVYQPNADITGAKFTDGQIVVIEGPHYPEPHRWYARVRLKKIYLNDATSPKDHEVFIIEKIIA